MPGESQTATRLGTVLPVLRGVVLGAVAALTGLVVMSWLGVDIGPLDALGGHDRSNMPSAYFDAEGRCVANFAAFNLNQACGLTPTGQIVEGRIGRQRIMMAPIERLCGNQAGSTSTRSL